MLDSLLDTIQRNPDMVQTNNPNALSQAYLHISDHDPSSDTKFTMPMFDPETTEYKEVDVTHKVIYINAATGVSFLYNSTVKNDPSFGYGYKPVGWFALAGVSTR